MANKPNPNPEDPDSTSIHLPQETPPNLDSTSVFEPKAKEPRPLSTGTNLLVTEEGADYFQVENTGATPIPGSDTTAFTPNPTPAVQNLDATNQAEALDSRPAPSDLASAPTAFPGVAPAEPDGLTNAQGARTKQDTGLAFSKPAPVDKSPLSRYRLKKFHARGGMGEVWLAEDTEIGRSVALKKIRAGIQGLRDSFMWEAQITGQLEHPGIVPVHELSLDEKGEPFYAMKFVHGKTLLNTIADFHDKTKPEAEPREVRRLRLMQIFLNLCQTMAYAHSRGVIHRDIKPENIMLGEYGETLVLDWGLAKIVGQDERASTAEEAVHVSGATEIFETIAGSVKGTPFYMSPESARGDVKAVDQQSDVYLLGATLYHILTNRRPRQGKTLKELVALAQQLPNPPRQFDATIPKPLDAICMKALAVDKKDRYASANALADDMERFLAGEPVSAYQESISERIGRWCRRHRHTLNRSAVALVILGLVTFGLYKYRELEQQWRDDQVKSALALQLEKDNRESAEKAANELRRQKQARIDLQAFRHLAEETRYLAANSDPVAANAPFFDVQEGVLHGLEALSLVAVWGPDLEKFPLAEERPALAKDLADLHLLLAQMRSEPAPNDDTAKSILEQLDRADRLQGPTRGSSRLRDRALRVLGRLAEADEAAKRAQDPKTPLTAQDHFLLGEKYRQQQRFSQRDQDENWKPNRATLESAAEEYRQALRLNPEHFWSHFQLGVCLQNLGRTSEAIQTLSTCIALRPDSPWGYSLRGLALALQKRFNEAEADLNKAINLDASFQPARLNRGVLAWLRKDDKDALADFDAVSPAPPKVAALEMQSNKPRLMQGAFAKAQLLAERGNLDSALQEVDRVLAEKTPIRSAFLLRAQLRFARGQDVGGLADLDAYFKQGRSDYDPQSPAAAALRGHRLRLIVLELPRNQRQGKLQLAEKQLKKATEGIPKAEVFDDLGMVYEYLGRKPEAIAAYTKALEISPKDGKIVVKRAWAYLDLPKPDLKQARADFEHALTLDADHAEAYTGLGYVEACRKDESAARRAAQQAVLHGAGDFLILHNVACIYAKLSEMEPKRVVEFEDQAIDHERRAIALWDRDRIGPNLMMRIQEESAFTPSLRARAEFRKLVESKPR